MQDLGENEEVYVPLPEGSIFINGFFKQEVQDDIQIAIQLTTFDSKMGPTPSILIGSACIIDRIDEDILFDTANEIDNQKVGNISGVIKDGFFKILMELRIENEEARGREDMFSLAIYFPEESLLTGEIKNLVPPTHGEMVDAVIEEEQAHLADLTALKRTLG